MNPDRLSKENATGHSVQLSRAALEEKLFLSLDAIARDPERAPDDHVDLARTARGLPPDVVDLAFAAALSRLVVGRPPGDPARSVVFLAAEQFAHQAGADRFGPGTKGLVATMLGETGAAPDEENRFEGVRARAHLHELRRAVGAPTTLAEIEAETELRELEPGLWLDLAEQELPSDAYLREVSLALEGRRMYPPEILPRLRNLIRLHGAGPAQRALDVCCLFLHRYGRYEEVRDLIARAERIAPRGWTIPCEDPVLGGNKGFRDAADLIAALEADLEVGASAVHVIQRYRILAIPLFAWHDEVPDLKMPSKFIEISLRELGISSLWHLATDVRNRAEDQNGRDWFGTIVFQMHPSPGQRAAHRFDSAAFSAFSAPTRRLRSTNSGAPQLLRTAGFGT